MAYKLSVIEVIALGEKRGYRSSRASDLDSENVTSIIFLSMMESDGIFVTYRNWGVGVTTGLCLGQIKVICENLSGATQAILQFTRVWGTSASIF